MEAAWAERDLPGVNNWRIDEWDTMRELVAHDTDPLTVLLAQARRGGLPIFANFRLNRYHPENGIVDGWFVEHPQFHLSPQRV